MQIQAEPRCTLEADKHSHKDTDRHVAMKRSTSADGGSRTFGWQGWSFVDMLCITTPEQLSKINTCPSIIVFPS